MPTLRAARPSRFAPLLLIAALLALLLPASASAVRTYQIDIKAHPSVFKEHTEVEVPLYLVENRAPDVDESRFAKYPLGIRELVFNFGSVHSRFVEFIPADTFDLRGTNVDTFIPGTDVYQNRIMNLNGRSRLYVRLASRYKANVPFADNSGITGRTELFVGTLRIAVGAAIPVGTEGRKIVLDVNFDDDKSAIDPLLEWWRSATPSWGDGSHMSARQIQFFTDPEPPEGIAPGDGAGTDPTPAPTPAPGPTPPALASVGFKGTLKAATTAKATPFTALTKAPAKGTPVVTVRLSAAAKLRATLAKVGKKGKLTRLKGTATVPRKGKTVYLKLTGSWNKKRLAKGTYRLTLTPPAGAARSVTFRVR